MFDQNVRKVLNQIEPGDIVLDIGGWACPFNRANYVMDVESYETRGFYGKVGLPASQGTGREHFSEATWIRRDICDRQPYPFRDKSVDFVICSHTLEDIRDPLWVCSEMVRVARRGYIEFPSRLAESSRGWESSRLAGLSHHRWLIDIDQTERSLQFTMKYHMIHSHWRFSFPASFLHSLIPQARVSWLFWEDSFTCSELNLVGLDAIASELEGYVASNYPYAPWRRRIDRAGFQTANIVHRALRKTTKRLRSQVSLDLKTGLGLENTNA